MSYRSAGAIMLSWFRKLFTSEPKWETVAYRPCVCAGCDRTIERNEKARRCQCHPGGMRHDRCMTGPGGTCPFCRSHGVAIVWK